MNQGSMNSGNNYPEMMALFCNARFFTGTEVIENKCLIIDGSRIAGFVSEDEAPVYALRIDCGGHLVTAGLIDLQIAGGGGCLFSSDPTPEALTRITEAIVMTGTTGFLLAMPTNTPEVYREAFRTIRENPNPALLGLHLEGPFISLAKRGAHARELIRIPSAETVREMAEEAGGAIAMMTVAPEACAPDMIRLLREYGITVAAGHSNATFREASEGFAAGIAAVTHLFNAMSPLHHRDPGLPGAVFNSDTACASIIADGIHVDFSMLTIAKKILKERLFLVSDAVEENDRGAYQHVMHPDRFTLPDGTLSGARLSMLGAVRNCVRHAGIDIYEAIRMATVYPAQLAGVKERGVIAAGARADLIMIDNNMELKGIFFDGKMKQIN